LEQDNAHTSYHPLLKPLVCFLFLAWITTGAAKAEYYEIVPSIYLTQEYNDNIFVTEDPTSDFITTVGPDLAILGVGERVDWNLSGGLRFRKYLENRLQHQQDWHAAGGVNYRPPQRSSMFTNASYLSDTRPDRIEDGFVTRGADRERYTFDIGGQHGLSEVTTPFVTYSYREEDFKFLPERNQRTNMLDFGIRQRLDRLIPMASGSAFFQFSHTDFATSDDDTARFFLGVEKTWSEKWRLLANAGIRYTKSTFSTLVPNASPPPALVPGEGTSDDWGPVTDISLNYTGEFTEIVLTAARNVVPASGQGRSVEQVRWAGSVYQRFTERFRGSLHASIQTQESFKDVNPAQAVDRWSFVFRPAMTYDINRYWSIDCHYRFYFLNDHERSREAAQNLIAATVSFRYPFRH